jgi:hypothetical protein
MAGKRSELIALGVDPRIASRDAFRPVKYQGKNCRDRQPWGGVTDPDRCDCGLDGEPRSCKADAEATSR